jgi:hypothetical protein
MAWEKGVDPSIRVQTPVLTPQSKVSVQDIAKGQSAPVGSEASDALESFGTKSWGDRAMPTSGRDSPTARAKNFSQFNRRNGASRQAGPVGVARQAWESHVPPIAGIGCCEPPQPASIVEPLAQRAQARDSAAPAAFSKLVAAAPAEVSLETCARRWPRRSRRRIDCAQPSKPTATPNSAAPKETY